MKIISIQYIKALLSESKQLADYYFPKFDGNDRKAASVDFV
jgi:hypothetical protein